MADFGKLVTEVKEWQETSAWCELKHPRTGLALTDDQGRVSRIRLTSPLSERWNRLDKAYYSQLRQAREAGQTRYTAEDVDRFEEHRVQCYIAVTEEWEQIERDGTVLVCNPKNMAWLYSHKWISDQLLAFMADLTNFGGPKDEVSPVVDDLIADSEKKFLTGVSGSVQ